MKSTKIEDNNTDTLEFPTLMVNDEGMVLLVTYTGHGGLGYTGTLVYSKFPNEIGMYRNDWSSQFKPYYGKITLEKHLSV